MECSHDWGVPEAGAAHVEARPRAALAGQNVLELRGRVRPKGDGLLKNKLYEDVFFDTTTLNTRIGMNKVIVFNQHKTNNSRVNELKSLVNPVLKVTNIHTNHSSQTYTFSSKNINKAPSCID